MSWKLLPKIGASIRKIEDSLLIYRWASFGLALLLFTMGTARNVASLSTAALLFFVLVYNSLLTCYLFYVRGQTNQYPFLLGLDILVCAFLIFATGGLRSPFYLYAFTPVLIAAYFFKYKGALISATTSGALFFVALNVSGYGISRIIQLGALNDYIVHFASFFLVAFFSVIPFALVDDLTKDLETESLCKEKLLSFHKVSAAISSSLQLKNVLKLVVSNTYELTKPKLTVVALFKQNHEFEIDPKSILSRDSDEPRATPAMYNEIQPFVHFMHGKKEPVLLTNTDLMSGDTSRFPELESLICVPLVRKGKYLGLLASIDPCSETNSDDIALLGVLGNLAACAIENARLVEKTQNLMIMEERNRIARDMHDGLSQSLFSLVLNLEICTRLVDSKPEPLKEKLIELRDFASKNLSQTRQYIYDLCPSELKNLGLSGAIETYTREFTSVNGIRAHFEKAGQEKNLSEDMQKALYYITQETLSNARKHACAQNVNVKLNFDENEVVLSVEDDGQGFDVAGMIIDPGNRNGRGLSNIKKRASLIGAECAIFSQEGGGAKVEVTVPLCSVTN